MSIVKIVPTNGSWSMEMTTKVQDITVDSSKAGRILSGVSFWDAPTAEKIVSFIDKAYASGEFVDLYWDNMVKDNIKELDVYVGRIRRQ